MPARAPAVTDTTAERLRALGMALRSQRTRLKVSATAAAEAAGLSRVTLHRIERGEPSVTIGAYLNVVAALGLEFKLAAPAPNETTADELPAHIRLADYPQLQQLAWQVQGVNELTAQEALGIYERNQRHLDTQRITPREQALIDALRRHAADHPRDV